MVHGPYGAAGLVALSAVQGESKIETGLVTTHLL